MICDFETRVSYNGLLYQPSKLRTRVRLPLPAHLYLDILIFFKSKPGLLFCFLCGSFREPKMAE